MGDFSMNRISFAVKSALGLAMLAPPALVLAQTTASAPAPTLEEVVTRDPGIARAVAGAETRINFAVEVVTGRHRQDAGQEHR
jgi:hypothetical protein